MKIPRLRRQTYILRALIIIVINLIVSQNLDINSNDDVVIFAIYFTVMIIIITLLNIGRLNDINLTGWYSLLFFIPIVNISLLALYFIDGTIGNNKYGRDPKDRVDLSSFMIQKKTLTQVDSNIELLKNTFEQGIINENELKTKTESLYKEKSELLDYQKRKEEYSNKIKGLKTLLENDLITQTEFSNKSTELKLKYQIKSLLSLDTKIYYKSNYKTYGPIEVSKVIKLIMKYKINHNCFFRTENEEYFYRRIYELLRINE